MKRVLRLFLALLLIPVALLTWLMVTETGLLWAYQQTKSYLPTELSMSKLEGRLIGPIKIEGIKYQQDGALIQADQILFNWHPVALLLANISISKLHIQSLNIALPKTESTNPTQPQTLTLPDIQLPWRVVLQDSQINDLTISQNNQSYKLKQITLNASTLFNNIHIEALNISDDRFNLNIKGDIKPARNYRHDLEIRWQVQLPSRVLIKGHGQLEGNLNKSLVKQQLQAPLQLALDAEIHDPLNRLRWQASINVPKFDSLQLNSNLPALSGKLKLEGQGDLRTATLSGNLDGVYDKRAPVEATFKLQRLNDQSLQIDQLKLYAPGNDTHLDISGQWRPGNHGGGFKLALNWQHLRWPLTPVVQPCTNEDNGNNCEPPPWFHSAHGSGTFEGNINDYRFELETDRPFPKAPPSHWYAIASGNLDGLIFQSLRVTTLNGEVMATGQLGWSPVLNWKANIKARNIDPASLWPQWPGRLNASMTSLGRYEKKKWIVDANIKQLKGQLRDYPVSLQSRLKLRDKKLDIIKLDFSSGSSQVNLRGQAGDAVKLNWTLASNDLAELYPQAKGELHARGQISGPQKTPLIKAVINGKSISYPNYELGAIDGSIAMDVFRWQQINIKLAAQALNLNSFTLQSLNIDANNQHLQVNAISKVATAQIELKGKLDSNGWQGRIERADMQSQRYTDWQLKAPSKLNISTDKLVADALCWNNNQQARVCTSIKRDADQWQLQFESSKLPLLVLDPWLPPDLKLDGQADATARLEYLSPDQVLGKAHIKLLPGSLNYPLLEGERDRWEYRGGKLDISLSTEELNASTDITMTNGDRFQASARLPKAKLLALDGLNQPVRASAKLNIHDLGLFEAIVPEIQELRGEAELNLSVDGTLDQPKLSGRAQLINGALRIPRLGLRIDQLSLISQSDGLGKLRTRLDAHSGEGNLIIKAHTTLNKTAGWPTEIAITGDQFEVSSIPEARVQISPDLLIKLQNRNINITGKVGIPYAKLQPKDITTAASVSDDAIIVGTEHSTEPKWSVITKIRLTLGDQVNFFGYGFEGRFGGGLLLEDEPGQLTKATGEINIPEGRYRAYGQRLDVEHGRLLYTGGPLTNPGLDLRAVRHINNVTAGVKVIGSLSKPQLELFSIPAMGQTDALSYLLLGRPMENASGEEGAMMAKAALALGLSGGDRLARILGDRFGLDEMRVESSETGDQASLVVGRYLSPKLYVSYGVGLIESINTLTVRYQISDKWQIKAESGDAQGADLLYTIER